MSNDGTTPPSITPARPAGASAVRTGPQRTLTDPPIPSPTTGPSGPAATQSTPVVPSSPGPSPAAYRQGLEEDGPSIGERLRNAAASVAETARNALPTRDHDEDDHPVEHARPAAAGAHERRTEPMTASAAAPAAAGPRRVRLAVARIDPWSVMKLSFLLSVAVGIMIVVASAVVWQTLDSLAVFTSLNDTIAEVTGSADFFPLLEYVAFDRMMSLATMIAVIDVVLLTALATIGAFLYNLVAALVGGIHVTLTDD